MNKYSAQDIQNIMDNNEKSKADAILLAYKEGLIDFEPDVSLDLLNQFVNKFSLDDRNQMEELGSSALERFEKDHVENSAQQTNADANGEIFSAPEPDFAVVYYAGDINKDISRFNQFNDDEYTFQTAKAILENYINGSLIFGSDVTLELFNKVIGFGRDAANKISDPTYLEEFNEVEKRALERFKKEHAENSAQQANADANDVVDEGAETSAPEQENAAADNADDANDAVDEGTETSAPEQEATVVYSAQDIQEVIDNNDENKAFAILQTYAEGNADFDSDVALNTFNDLINKFCRDAQGNLNEVGARAVARFESDTARAESELNKTPERRIYSLTSDQNQDIFDRVTFKIFQHMGLLDSAIDVKNLTPAQVVDYINSVNLDDAQRGEFSSMFVDAIVSNRDLFELTPPSVLTDAYVFARDKYLQDKNDKKHLDQFNLLARRIDDLIVGFHDKINYFYSDPSNIADVWAGYNKMCDVRSKDLRIDEKNDNQETISYKRRIKDAADGVKQELAEVVKTYSELWNLQKLKPENAKELEERWKKISEKLNGVELDDEMLTTLSKYKFLDENGNQLPQFLDENGNESLEYKPGYKIKPDGRLATLVRLSKNDVTMQNVGALDTDVDDLGLDDKLREQIPWNCAYSYATDQKIHDAMVDPENLTKEEVQTFWDKVNATGGELSDPGYQATLFAHCNRAAGWTDMVGAKVGYNNPVVFSSLDAVQDIDQLAKTRTEKIGAQARKQKVGLFKRMLKNFGVAAGVSAGLTFLGKATGISWIGAAVGATIGIGNMFIQGFKWRKEQKRQRKPHGIKDFFSDKRNWGPALATGLGTAAAICMATGNPALATGLGIGAMTVGGTSSAISTYKDCINAGWTPGRALAGAIGVAGSVVAGGFVGRAAMNSFVDYVNNNTDSTLFKHESFIEHSGEPSQITYDESMIQHHQDMMIKNGWETQGSFDAKIDGLMDGGLNHDQAVRYLLIHHDVTDHNLYNDGIYHALGIEPGDLDALRGSISGNEVNISDAAMRAFNVFEQGRYINYNNQIVLPPELHSVVANTAFAANAHVGADGRVYAGGNDFYTSYANHYGEGINYIEGTPSYTESIFTPNELAFPAGIGMIGVYHPRVISNDYVPSLQNRVGALAGYVDNKLNQHDRQNGLNGRNGYNGQNGYNGRDGLNGRDGYNGQNGYNGRDGLNGRDGYNGQNGYNGRNGLNGRDGRDADSKPEKRGFFGWLKDGVKKVINGIWDLKDLRTQRKEEHKMKQDQLKQQEELQRIANQIEKMSKEYELAGAQTDAETKHQLKLLSNYMKVLKKSENADIDYDKLFEIKNKLHKLDMQDIDHMADRNAILKRIEEIEDILAQGHVNAAKHKAQEIVDSSKHNRKMNNLNNKLEELSVEQNVTEQETQNAVSTGEKVQEKMRNLREGFLAFFGHADTVTKGEIQNEENKNKLASAQRATSMTKQQLYEQQVNEYRAEFEKEANAAKLAMLNNFVAGNQKLLNDMDNWPEDRKNVFIENWARQLDTVFGKNAQ